MSLGYLVLLEGELIVNTEAIARRDAHLGLDKLLLEVVDLVPARTNLILLLEQLSGLKLLPLLACMCLVVSFAEVFLVLQVLEHLISGFGADARMVQLVVSIELPKVELGSVGLGELTVLVDPVNAHLVLLINALLLVLVDFFAKNEEWIVLNLLLALGHTEVVQLQFVLSII